MVRHLRVACHAKCGSARGVGQKLGNRIRQFFGVGARGQQAIDPVMKDFTRPFRIRTDDGHGMVHCLDEDDTKWNDAKAGEVQFTYGDVFKQNEVEFSAYNLEAANTAQLFKQFEEAEAECQSLLAHVNERSQGLVLPAYDQCIKASHRFNLLDARGVIGVTERASYIGRVRALAKACCEAWVKTQTEAA
jgi:glycyl-tRNA synthetase alpha subunit